MLPSFITNLLWGSREETGYSHLPSDEDYFIAEQHDDWVLITEQGRLVTDYYYVNKAKHTR